MVPRYVRIKKLPAKYKQPHVSEGLRVGSGTAGYSSKRQRGQPPVAGKPVQGRGWGWGAAKQGPWSRRGPGVAKRVVA